MSVASANPSESVGDRRSLRVIVSVTAIDTHLDRISKPRHVSGTDHRPRVAEDGMRDRALLAEASQPRRLNASDVELASAFAAGRTDAEIAAALALPPENVEAALTELCHKLGVESRTELALFLGALADAGRSAPDEVARADGQGPNTTGASTG